MKINQYIAGLILAVAAMTGCSQDNIMVLYESETGNYISFRNGTLNKELEKTDNTLFIPVYRENTQGKALVKADLLFQQNPDGSEAPGRELITLQNDEITFAKGSNVANIILNIDLAKLDYLTKAKIKITLTPLENCHISPFGKSTLAVSLNRKPTWYRMEEKGTYTSQFLGTSKEVVVEKAEEAPFYIIKDCYVTNGDIRIDLDKDGNADVRQQKAFRHQEYGIVYVAGTGKLDSASNTIVNQLYFMAEQDGKWGILSGISFEETLKLPGK